MKILATDLDRTLLPNGKWECDEKAISLFNDLVKKNNIMLVYITGRNLNLTEEAIKTYGVRHPDILCGDVGTTIREYKNGQWRPDDGWDSHVKKASPKWNVEKIKSTLAKIDGLKEQDKEHLNQFKQSYFVNLDNKDEILANVDKVIKEKFDEVIIYSFDSQDNKGLLDILPNSATKQTSLEYVALKFKTAKKDIVFCGDSGNDILPLTAGFCGVLVKNADEQLVKNVNQAMNKNSSLKVYFAKGGFMGLNGNYTSGVIEGAFHYSIFKK